MEIPVNYPPELKAYLDMVTKEGIVPSYYHVNSISIQNELIQFINERQYQNFQTLILGVGDKIKLLKIKNCDFIENRESSLVYRSADTTNLSRELKSAIITKDHDCYIFFADWLATQDLDNDFLAQVNMEIIFPKKFYVIERYFDNIEKFLEVSPYSGTYNWIGYRNWFKQNSSHMHLGYKVIELQYVRVFDLSPEY